MASSTSSPIAPPIHFVGCFEPRVTLYFQQVRALNLIHDLLEAGQVPTQGRIAIIGAGAAGITAATALSLAEPDAIIDIFEAESQILNYQYNVYGRYLRPHIYKWPAPGASETDAGLPILNWTVGLERDLRASK
jgi:hypothetical protein